MVISCELVITIFEDLVLQQQFTWFTLLHIIALILLASSVKQSKRISMGELLDFAKQKISIAGRDTEKSKMFTALLNNIPCAIATIDKEYYIRSVNAELLHITGVEKENTVGKICYHVFGSGQVCPNCPVERVFKSGVIEQNVKVEINHKNQEIHIEQIAIPVLDGAGEIEYVLEVVVDATEKMRLQRQHDQLLSQTITALVNLIERRDQYTGSHSHRVQDIAVKIGKKLGLEQKELQELSIAAVLHDIGKIGSPEHILNKPSTLNDEEYEIIKKHPRIGYEALCNVDSLKKVAKIILDHHERIDGKGYPAGKKVEDISVSARILSVADVYEAVTADRIYRKALTKEDACKVIKDGRDTQFDPVVVDALLEILQDEIGPL